MSEPARVRLVRCPNCQNLLPELAAYSVYRCGGCSTVLRAKTGGIGEKSVLDKSSENQEEKGMKSFDGSDWEDDDTSGFKFGKQNDMLEEKKSRRRTSRDYDWKMEKRGAEIMGRNQDMGVEHVKFPEYGRANDDGWYKNEYKEQNPSEILRQLDELKVEICRSYQVEDPHMHKFHHGSCLQIGHNRQSALPSSSSSFQTRVSGGLSSELVGFSETGHKKAMRPTTERRCFPIAGGCPFVICCNCSKLLQIPRKAFFSQKAPKKMQCGACLAFLLLEIFNRKLVISSCDEQSQIINEGFSKFNLQSDGYDQNQYMNGKSNSSSGVQGYTNSFQSSSPRSSMEDKESDRVPPPPPKGSSLQEYFEYSNIFRAVEKSGMEEEAALHKSAMEGTSSATEIDVSFEYTNSGTSQESGRSRTSSFFAGFKKSIRDFSISSHGSDQETTNVVVNGHAITDRLVKKAEKLAGPIQPGNYWYDFRAGFWGVVGGPCLGIIPPFIEELNHPLERNCAGGETGVVVNGRELHPKDFNLLCSRGLPRETNRSYVVEISGRILDEISGEELVSLGCLAPSVQKSKRGFGMKPRIKPA